jgi:hypothetical protein
VSDQPIHMTPSGPPRTVLPPEHDEVNRALRHALAEADVREALAMVVERHPKSLAAWAELADHGRDPVERYAAYRVGYHRGLDALRANGWRGSGYVRWDDPTNRPFLRCLKGLGDIADGIGEIDEAERIALFLVQLDPWTFSGSAEHH